VACRFDVGVEIVRVGGDVSILAIGAIAVEAVAAAELLVDAGVCPTVGIVSTLNPALADVNGSTRRRVTAHSAPTKGTTPWNSWI
jgi:transketolase C-terminal domain/subunit